MNYLFIRFHKVTISGKISLQLMINIVSHINPDKKWNIRKEEVFDPIETFKQRCYDIIEICKALVIFGRYNRLSSFLLKGLTIGVCL